MTPSGLRDIDDMTAHLVRRYIAYGVERDDLRQVARMAVISAMPRSPDRAYWCRAAISKMQMYRDSCRARARADESGRPITERQYVVDPEARAIARERLAEVWSLASQLERDAIEAIAVGHVTGARSQAHIAALHRLRMRLGLRELRGRDTLHHATEETVK